MKLDQTPEKETAVMQVNAKKRESHPSSAGNSGSILELLNPLKSININSDLHSFYNFRESKESIEALLKAQSNLVFYVLHQNFMCDDANKEFFKNIVGRFYDLPERLMDYYRGDAIYDFSNYSVISGLVLLENKNFYDRLIKSDNLISRKYFKNAENSISRSGHKILNALCLEEYWGGGYISMYSAYYVPSNKKDKSTRYVSNTRASAISFDNAYEYGRFKTTNCMVQRDTGVLEENYWFIVSLEELNKMDKFPIELSKFISFYGLYSSIGLERKQEIVDTLKKRAHNLDLLFDDSWIPNWSTEDEKMIRSLSQTFPWDKEYIYENEELLNLDVLGLNMSIPWDMDLVKFFVKRGYGGRMSENKAVFDRVFKPLLTDGILEMLFRLEYEKY